MENVATYSEARSEYTKQMASMIVPGLFAWFQSLWARNASDKQRCLALFQGDCEEVSRWNQDRIQDEVRALVERSGCDYMEELMTAVFIAHTKILTAVRLSTKQKKLSITVPKLDHFLHRVFRESARCFWKAPYLFMDSANVVDRQKNVLQAEQLLTEAIGTAVRGLLPVKQILKDYIEEGEDVEDVPALEISEVVEVPPTQPKAQKPKPLVPLVTETEAPEIKEAEAEAETKTVETKTVETNATETAKVTPKPKAVPPAVVSFDTEPSVSFSDHVSVFDETQEPEMREMAPQSNYEDSSDAIQIDEGSTSAITDDIEDLEAPEPSEAPKVKAKISEEITDDDVVVLD
jgi:hypothetical protein